MKIIDANNLAGKMGILEEEDFDKELIDVIQNRRRKEPTILVFDSNEPLGDKFQVDNIEVIYAPVDMGADNKIIELLKLKDYKDITLITDDVELINRVIEDNDKIKIVKASDFASRLLRSLDIVSNELGNKDKDDINKELLDIWK